MKHMFKRSRLTAYLFGLSVILAFMASHQRDSFTANVFAESDRMLQRPVVMGAVVSVPAGSRFWVQLQHPVASHLARPGDTVTATLLTPLHTEGQLLAQAGSLVQGQVVACKPVGRGTGKERRFGSLQLRFTHIRLSDPFSPLALEAVVDTGKPAGVLQANTYDALLRLHYTHEQPTALPYLLPSLRGEHREVELQAGQPLRLVLNKAIHVGGTQAPFRLVPLPPPVTR